MYIFRDEDYDITLTEECIMKLSEAHWPKLTKIDIGSCSLKGPSCRWIVKADWTHLT